MAKNDADTKPTLQQLQWLLERVNAKRDPITCQQVEVFGRHPGGPILPAECIAVERLPDNFGTRREGQSPLEDDQPIHDLAVSSEDYNLWVATVINGESVLRCFGRHVGTPEHKEPSNELRHLALRTDEERGPYYSPHIIGFSYGAPVVRLQIHQTAWTDDALVYIGQGQKFADQLPTTRTSAMHVAQDGAVLTAHPLCDGQWSIYRDGTLVCDLGGEKPGGLWQCGDDVVWTNVLHDGLSAYNFRKPDPIYLLQRLVFDHNIRDVFMYNGAPHYVTTDSDGRSACLHRMGLDEHEATSTRIIWSSNGHAYLRGFTELPDGRIAYIGETARDRQECWVVDGVACPGFDRVTGLVFRESRARYWGALDRHLYTMELPRVTEKKTE